METRFYQAPDLNIEHIAYDLEGIFFGQGYHVQHFGNREQMVVQIKLGSDIEAMVGMQAALTLTLQNTPRGMLASLGQQQWVDKAAVGTVGFLLLWPLALTAGIGVFRQVSLEGQVFSSLDAVVQRQRADVHIGAVPPDMQPPQGAPYQQQPGAPPQPGPQRQSTPREIQCANCHEVNEEGDRYCSHCGKPLTAQKKECPSCHAEVKPNAEFCTKCGTAFAA